MDQVACRTLRLCPLYSQNAAVAAQPQNDAMGQQQNLLRTVAATARERDL
jgi:hypothetical protein